jgi:hypothetical protein
MSFKIFRHPRIIFSSRKTNIKNKFTNKILKVSDGRKKVEEKEWLIKIVFGEKNETVENNLQLSGYEIVITNTVKRKKHVLCVIIKHLTKKKKNSSFFFILFVYL